MPFATIAGSPLAGRPGPVQLFYRTYGHGFPLVFLHGGWGYQIYPFGRQIDALSRRFRILIPDRSGYGQSGRIDALPSDFHHRAAAETRGLLDSLGVERAVLWGHSDGSVISVLMALQQPERFSAVILEAFHYYRAKPISSHSFFETAVQNPESFGDRVVSTLVSDHGQDYWKQVLRMNGQAWLDLAKEARPEPDLYRGRLNELKMPVMVLHGSRDPRTEPDELAAVERELPGALSLIEGGGHSPHSEEKAFQESARVAGRFLDTVSTWLVV